jgi:hypothetical protein
MNASFDVCGLEIENYGDGKKTSSDEMRSGSLAGDVILEGLVNGMH